MANSLRAKLKKLNYEGKITDEELKELLDKLDGHDKELVKHERWVMYNGFYFCSACKETKLYKTPYCSNCGAKMDEEVE